MRCGAASPAPPIAATTASAPLRGGSSRNLRRALRDELPRDIGLETNRRYGNVHGFAVHCVMHCCALG